MPTRCRRAKSRFRPPILPRRASVDRLVKRLHRLAYTICAPDHFGNGVTNDSERDCYKAAVRTGMAQIEAKREMALRASGVHVATADPAAKPAN